MGIISENRNSWLIRRHDEIDDFVNNALSRVDPNDYSFHDYVVEIGWQVADEYGQQNVPDLNELLDYVSDNFWKRIEKHYLESTDN